MATRTTLVIGGSSGIGRALVQELTDAGEQVVVWSRQPGDLSSLSGVTHYAIDVLQDELPAAALPADLAAVAYLPGSINLKPFRSLRAADFRQEFELNVLGAVRCLQAVEKQLKHADQAAVVLFSTVAVQRGMPFHASVAAAKGAIEGLTRSLAAEWAPRIRVNAIAPSLTDTPLAERLLATAEKRDAAAARHPLRRVGQAGEIAALAAYLLSARAAFVTGQVIGIDGGMSRI